MTCALSTGLLSGQGSFTYFWVGVIKDLDSGGIWKWSTGEALSDELTVVDGNYIANTHTRIRRPCDFQPLAPHLLYSIIGVLQWVYIFFLSLL